MQNDRERDYTSALRRRRFKWCNFSTSFIILFHMLDSFYLSGLLPIALINYASSYRKIELGPMNNARD